MEAVADGWEAAPVLFLSASSWETAVGPVQNPGIQNHRLHTVKPTPHLRSPVGKHRLPYIKAVEIKD